MSLKFQLLHAAKHRIVKKYVPSETASTNLSLASAAFWLLVASLVKDAAMLLMQCPYYQYTGTHFADLGRMSG